MKPGLYPDIPEAVYHADPCVEPSLSSSIAITILDEEKSLKHGWLKHPRLNPNFPVKEMTRDMVAGTAIHALVLGRGHENITRVMADDYRTNEAKKARDTIIRAGKTPVLTPDYEHALFVAGKFRKELNELESAAGFFTGQPEMTVIVKDVTGIWLRARIDMLELYDDHAVIWDFKTGKQSANPRTLGRRIANMGYEIQAAFYERALVQLYPHLAGRITYKWAFIETDEPYFLQVSDLSGNGVEVGKRKVSAAVGLWANAMKTGEWPDYPREMTRAEYPVWAERNWMDRELNDPDIAHAINSDPFLCRPIIRQDTSLTEIAP